MRTKTPRKQVSENLFLFRVTDIVEKICILSSLDEKILKRWNMQSNDMNLPKILTGTILPTAYFLRNLTEPVQWTPKNKVWNSVKSGEKVLTQKTYDISGKCCEF